VKPLFVGGCERSGTTMLGAMLGASRRCITVPESQFIEHQFERVGFDPGALNPREVLAGIIADERYRLLWQMPLQPEDVRPEQVGTTYPRLLTWLVREYARTRDKPSAEVWVDHSPNNFPRALTLLRLFPEARFIHLVRDGRAVAASLLPLDWGPNNTLHAAEYWMARTAAGLLAESELGAERVLRVTYEELVAQPELAMQRLCSFAGLNYESAMAAGAGEPVGRYHERQHQLVGQPPDRSRVDAWRRALTAREIEIFEAEAGDFLTLLGYEPVFGIRARPASRFQVFQLRIADFARRAGNNLRRQRRARNAIVG